MSHMQGALENAQVERARRQLGRLAVLGLAAAVLALWFLYTPAGALGKADAVAYAVCHRIELRSFHLGDRPLPLCARCTGMYLGAMVGLAYFVAAGRGRSGRLPPKSVLIALAAFVAVFAIDGLNSYLGFFPGAPQLYEPSNNLRLVSGTLLGVALGVVVYAIFNQNAWRNWRDRSPVASLRELAPIVLLAAAAIGAVLTENPLLLYPLALISSAGVVLLLTGIYTTMALILLRRENVARGWTEMILPGALGLTLAFLQLGLFGLVRYLATGTWSGFTL